MYRVWFGVIREFSVVSGWNQLLRQMHDGMLGYVETLKHDRSLSLG